MSYNISVFLQHNIIIQYEGIFENINYALFAYVVVRIGPTVNGGKKLEFESIEFFTLSY